MDENVKAVSEKAEFDGKDQSEIEKPAVKADAGMGERDGKDVTPLSAEAILKRAKAENEKFGDERQRGKMQWAGYAGFDAMILSCAIVVFVTVAVGDAVPYVIWAVMETGLAVQTIVQACALKKAARVLSCIAAALITAGALVFWTLWIMQLCGVII